MRPSPMRIVIVSERNWVVPGNALAKSFRDPGTNDGIAI
jgi:hypothetical protein